MSDKISDKRLEWIRASYVASSKGHAFVGHPSYDERVAIIDELLALRKAAVPKAYIQHANYLPDCGRLTFSKIPNSEEDVNEYQLWDEPLFTTPQPAPNTVTPSDAAKVARGFGYVTNGQASDIEDALEMVAKGVSPLEAVNKIEANDEEES